MLRTLIYLIIAVWLFTVLHWTQRWDKATVITRGPCAVATAEAHDGLCTYRDVKVEGTVLRRAYLLHVGDTDLEIQSANVIGMSWVAGDTGFTWLTYLLGLALLACLALAVWPVFPRRTGGRPGAATN